MTYVINPSRFATGGGISSPEDISGLFLWLDATDTSYLWQDDSQTTAVSSDSDPVGTWRNKASGGSSEDFTRATGTAQPTYNTATQNGLAVISFDGTDYLQYTSTIAGFGSDFTFFIVAKNNNSEAVYQTYCTATGSTNSFRPFVDTRSSPRRICGYPSNVFLDLADEKAATANLISVKYDIGAGIYGYFNGTLEDSTTGGISAPDTSSSIIGAFNAANLNLNGFIGEILAYNSLLSDTDRESVEAYLMDRWGIT